MATSARAYVLCASLLMKALEAPWAPYAMCPHLGVECELISHRRVGGAVGARTSAPAIHISSKGVLVGICERAIIVPSEANAARPLRPLDVEIVHRVSGAISLHHTIASARPRRMVILMPPVRRRYPSPAQLQTC